MRYCIFHCYSIYLYSHILHTQSITTTNIEKQSDGHSKPLWNEPESFDRNNTVRVKPKMTENKQDTLHYIDFINVLYIFKQKYPLPFQPSIANNYQLILFRNAMDFKLIGAKPVRFDYNIEHHAFKLTINFYAKLSEYYQNTNNEFPFEWQFLNLQIPYRIKQYSFQSKMPEFVEKAFVQKAFWPKGSSQWKYSVLVRKKESVEEWKLLKPWVDLRKNREKYDFQFGLIKYRVRRNPKYYILAIIIPLFFMVTCVFHVVLGEWDKEDLSMRLTYIITLLLAIAAFQISITDGLPYKSQFTLIDQYFLLAYLIMVGMVCETSISRVFDDDNASWFEHLCGAGLFVIWLIHTMTFIFKWIEFHQIRFSSNDLCKLCCKDWSHAYGCLCCLCGFPRCGEFCRDCCIVGCTCCKHEKMKKRVKIWKGMENTESSLWDTTTQLHALSKKTELVLGTNADIAIFQENKDDKWEKQFKDLVVRGESKEIENEEKKETGCCKRRKRQDYDPLSATSPRDDS